MESRLLRILLQALPSYTPLVDILRELQIRSETLTSLLATLSSWGYRIDDHPIQGVRILDLPSPLHLDEVRARLPENFNWRLSHVRETLSTMDFIKREGRQGAPHGLLLVADSQSAGRGRLGRSWSSQPNTGLYLSVLLRPDFGLESFSRITILTAVATLETLEAITPLQLQIKWPNDIMYQRRKLSGILTEAHRDINGQWFAVVGMGLNLLQQEFDFPEELRGKATSVLQSCGEKLRHAEFLAQWIPCLQKAFLTPFPEISERWKSRCLTLGEPIQVETPQGKISGTALDLETNGTLILRADNGTHHSIQSGFVIH